MHNKSLFKSLTSILLIACLLITSCSPSDAKIAESAKAKVTAISPSVSVDVKDGVVTLSGEVTDDATKAATESALQGLKGVKSVVNNLTVPPPPPPPVVINPDDVLRTIVDSVFNAKGIKGITATVSNGEVTLTGEVKKAERIKAMQVVNEAKPKKVINQIKDIK